MSAATPANGSWADVLAEGRLPLFALICMGVWLNAADSLIAATIMPSVGRSLGGYAYFGWATAGYLLGSVLAGASSGVLALRFGLRSATAAAALLYAGGCALSAVAPEIFTFLAGRMLQGVGRGWVVGLCSVAIGLLFPKRQLPEGLQRDQLGLGHRRPGGSDARRLVRRTPVPGAPCSGCSPCRERRWPAAAWVMLPAPRPRTRNARWDGASSVSSRSG